MDATPSFRRPTTLRRLARAGVLAGLIAGLAVTVGARPARAADPVKQAPTKYTLSSTVTWVNVPAHSHGEVTARCADGQQLIGGGFSVNASDYRGSVEVAMNQVSDVYPVYADAPTEDGGWNAGLLNRGSSTVILFVRAACASSPIGLRVEYGSGTAAGGATAHCPAGTTVTAGGWQRTAPARLNDVLETTSSLPVRNADGSGWKVTAERPTGSAATASSPLRAVALCVDGDTKPGHDTETTVVAPSDPGKDVVTTGAAQLGCGGGELATSPGFSRLDGEGYQSLTTLAPVAADPPLQGELVVNSLPRPRIDEPPFNDGAKVTLHQVCVRPPLLWE
jgi:hypothetical protein